MFVTQKSIILKIASTTLRNEQEIPSEGELTDTYLLELILCGFPS